MFYSLGGVDPSRYRVSLMLVRGWAKPLSFIPIYQTDPSGDLGYVASPHSPEQGKCGPPFA